MVVALAKHEMSEGVLTIDVDRIECVDDSTSIHFEFKCVETGAIFDMTYHNTDLVGVKEIFGEHGELFATLMNMPKVSVFEDLVIVHFIAEDRDHEYHIDFELERQVYKSDGKEIAELRAENAAISQRLAKVENYLDLLATTTLLSHHDSDTEFCELTKLINSPLLMMEKVTDQDRLIHALRNDPNLTTWFKSLKPDLRKFQPIKSNGRGLSNVMIDNNEPDGSAGIQLARFLISINVDVNHVYSHTWNYERACFTCRRSEKKYGESDSHRCTPLDAVQGEIEKHKLNGLVHQSQKLTNFFINWNKRLQDLYEVERTLIAAGAKTYDELSQNM